MSTPTRAFIPPALAARLKKLDYVERSGMKIVENFAIFIDTHRDQPHVGSFGDDIHRGMCRPTKVDYVIGDDLLIEQESGKVLQRHDKHLFVEEDWFSEFILTWLLEHDGKSPLNADNEMPTSHLRDPRSKTYYLRSFRQMVVFHYNRRNA